MAITRMYRSLLRVGGQFTYTDKNFFRRRLRQEFEKRRHATDPKLIEIYYAVRALPFFFSIRYPE
jgi:hypothetical protein